MNAAPALLTATSRRDLLAAGGAVTLPDVYATNLIPMGGARISTWVRDGGRLGHT